MPSRLPLKSLVWIGSSKKELTGLPPDVRWAFGYALHEAQAGGKHPTAKALKGFGGSSVMEVVESDDGGTYRAVYTVRFRGVVYVLHAFQKKSKNGIATPKTVIELVRARLKLAEQIHNAMERGPHEEEEQGD